MYVNKFLTFSISTLLELAGGVQYCFSVYSPALKHSLGYTQTQIQGVANPLLPTLIAGWIPGLVHDALQRHNRFGPRFVLLIGGFIHGVGYLGLWLVGTHRLVLPYWMVVATGVLAFNGMTWVDTASIAANVRNFPHDRGTAIGILKAMMGLSASVYTTFYVACFRPHAISFLLFIAGVPVILSLLAFPIFNGVPFRQQSEHPAPGAFCNNSTRFSVAYTSILAMGLLMLMFAELDTSNLTPALRTGMITGVVVVLCPLLFLSLNSGGYWARPALDSPSVSSGDEETGNEGRSSTTIAPSLVDAVTAPSPAIDAQDAALRRKVPHSSGDSVAGSLHIPAAHDRVDDQQSQASAQGADDCSAPKGLPINGRHTLTALVSAPHTGSCTFLAHSVAPREGAMPQSSASEWWPLPSEQHVRGKDDGVEQDDSPHEAESTSGYSAQQDQAVTSAPSRRSSLRQSLQGSLRNSPGRNVANPQLQEVLLDLEEEEEVKQVAPQAAVPNAMPSAAAHGPEQHTQSLSKASSFSRGTGDSAESLDKQWPLEVTLRESLTSLNFWLLFFVFGMGSANSLLFLNNAGQIVQALQGPQDGQDPLLTLFSVLNALGRLACGYFPERALHLFGTPRPVFMVVVAASSAIVSFATAYADMGMLWIMAPVSGFVYGCHWSLVPAMTSEFFGLGHFGLLYCVVQSSVTIFSFGISNMLGGFLYQARVKEHGDVLNICIGADCFRTAFLVAAALEVLAVGATMWLLTRTRHLYAQEYRDIVREEKGVERCSRTGHRLCIKIARNFVE